MTRRCQATIAALPGIGRDNAQLPPAVARHVEECFRCRGELARYRKLLRRLRQLQDYGFEPPPRLLDQLLENLADPAQLGSAGGSSWARRRIAYLSVAACAAGAAGAGAVLLALRGKSRTRLAG